ncbi:hypothetical protein [Clostridium botulinum]|uniref:hypothetical protein n=1 Tax=Clostridium botulinum TaxID=1491 RepID=UPI000774995F|nr:hypothetical protein [Clostridium botulinum]MBY6931694.1 hypothetical protein [Clostridium botulinum]NFG20522.1 hypothetical protein [Clostridium botulinum]NFO80694.1 hypothetical protein [Clostridium botulinum]
MENIISNLIGVTIGGIIATFIAMWQVKKQNKVNENIAKKKIRLTSKKLDMYFSNIENIFKTTYKANRKNIEEFHINIMTKPEIVKTDFDITNDLVQLLDLLNETEINDLFKLYNKINEAYARSYNYNNRYTNDSNTEYTQGAEESEIVNFAIDDLLKCFEETRAIMNKLRNIA